jgi:uncharacterized membrane protein YbhN (UPF0104 family)
MRRLTAPFRRLPDGTHAPFPRLGLGLLGVGLVLQTCCFLLVTISLAAVIASVRSDFDVWARLPGLTAKLAAATVLGFVIPTPAGIGTREWALAKMLTDDLGADYAVLAAILTRLVWIVAECLIVSFLFPFRYRAAAGPPGEKAV